MGEEGRSASLFAGAIVLRQGSLFSLNEEKARLSASLYLCLHVV